jgi:DNA-binding MarR family transcriptional regulator
MTDSEQISVSIRQWLETVTSRSMRDGTRYMKAAGLSWPQFGVMMRLYHGGSCAVSEIGKHMGVTSAAASQLIDGLVERGLLERFENPEDRRLKRISVSQKGRAFVQEGMAERYRWVDEMVASLTADERATILPAITLLTEAARKIDG